MSVPSEEAVRVAVSLLDKESTHADLGATLFHFLKSPTGEPVSPNAAWEMHHASHGGDSRSSARATLRRLVDLQEPFGVPLALPALRNWFLLLNHVVTSAVGSEARLKFKYSVLTPIAVLALHMPRSFPEFLARLTDYLEAWKKRLVFDSEAMEILYSAYRGDPGSIEAGLAHANGQTASHFILLREEYLSRKPSAETAASAVSVENTPAEGTSNLLPSYLMELMVCWNSSTEGGPAGGSDMSGEVAEWYRSTVGHKMLSKIESGRQEIEEKYTPLLGKFRSMDDNEIERSKGQLLVLLKREFKRRVDLINEELQLIALLDSRHALMTRKFDLFARLKLFLDKSMLQSL
eukprot:Gregarina_sp_Pseudo_9__305@NODE_1199_length_1785_cov_9_495991_g1125_i0_p1_GENE_NODE_1199_length_1785_cov_9_495991_g1125_i0NODE_1199_length_1785_cov_9_495991_g1125_i0_p1_ORF_typecomplete_len379_score99_01FANCI_S1/PF14675_6/0_19DUF3887/PF13026_6/0_18_NODE_1199_length_1785_cov_9_495991_g1125_i0911137